MENFLHPNHPLIYSICGPSSSCKSVFLTNLFLNIIKEYDKIYYSSSHHQDLYLKLTKWFSKYIPIHMIPKVLTEKDFDLVFGEVIKTEDFEKSDTERNL